MSINSMREHREKMLAIKAQKQAQSPDPRLRKKAVIMGSYFAHFAKNKSDHLM